MTADGDADAGIERAALATLIPRLAYELVDRYPSTPVGYEQIEGTLLSADISGFTRLTEELAGRGREGAEIITVAVNSCFEDLITAAAFRGGDVLKFGGDAVLVLFTGLGHQQRAVAAAVEMQHALRLQALARRHRLRMTVGVADGVFHAILIGGHRRDVLLCGPATTETLRLEDSAEIGEVVISESLRSVVAPDRRAGSHVLIDDREWAFPEPPEVPVKQLESFVPASLRSNYVDYADLGAEHRRAAIGFVMIDGVDDHLAAHGGDATAQALAKVMDQVHRRLEPMGVVVLHSDMAMGGVKLLIGAGVPSSIDDPADALLHAAVEVASIDSPFVLRQGLNVGTLFAGFLGARRRRTFTVMSDMVNTAARMVGHAGPSEIVAVETVIERSRSRVEGELLGPLMVKGKSEPVSARRIRSLSQDRIVDVDADFVGRVRELDELAEAFRRGTNVTIAGPTGSGKTRLAEEGAPEQGTVGSAGGRYMTATPYGAFWAGMRALVGIESQLGADETGHALATAFQRDHEPLAPYVSLIAPVFGGQFDENDLVRAIEPEFRRDIIHETVTELLGRMNIATIVLEDTQWLDDASTELITHLQVVSADRGWVVVQSLREPPGSALSEQDAGTADGVRIDLGPMSDTAISAIITQTSRRQLLRHEVDRLVERAEGNPLFALELARSVGQKGEEIPGSIEEVVATRIDRLPSRRRHAVRLASVLGARFRLTTFEALVDASGFEVETDLAAIDEIFDVDRVSGMVRFRQLLYLDVAYASLPFARRKRFHRTVGEYLESTVDDLDAISALLSQHFSSGQDRKRCWTYSIRAAERAMDQNSPGDAITLYQRALAMAPRGIDAAEKADAHEGLGHALLAAGNAEEAFAAFGKARRFVDNAVREVRLRWNQAECRNRQGRYRDAMRMYSHVAQNCPDDRPEYVAALIGRSSVLYKQGRNAQSYTQAAEAYRVARLGGHRAEQGRASQLIAVAGEPIGAPDHREAAVRALHIFGELEMFSAEAEIRNNLGVSAQLDGDLDEALEHYNQSLELKERVGDLSGAAMVRMNLGEVKLDRSDTEGVDELLRSCLATFERTGFVVGAAYTQGLLGRCALLRGAPGEARDLLTASSALFDELGGESYAADMDLHLIGVLIDLGATDQARDLIDRNRERVERAVFDNPQAATLKLAELETRLR